MNGINVQHRRSVITGGVTIKHTETATFDCRRGEEPQDREFECDDCAWIPQVDDKNWTFENNGAFPQCRNG